MMNKKANVALALLAVIVVVIILYLILINALKECRQDSQCGEGSYCGSDFRCHEMKVIQKSVINNEYHLWKASFVIGIAIIIAAIILRLRRQ
ncbi:hypothetical protein GF345_01115 [Candidatus Woesearchaeota archaeon]|nr:hypothetical protein [Candidatus Woesearchaeota archaeon]